MKDILIQEYKTNAKIVNNLSANSQSNPVYDPSHPIGEMKSFLKKRTHPVGKHHLHVKNMVRTLPICTSYFMKHFLKNLPTKSQENAKSTLNIEPILHSLDGEQPFCINVFGTLNAS